MRREIRTQPIAPSELQLPLRFDTPLELGASLSTFEAFS
jgi:hypothetical protein